MKRVGHTARPAPLIFFLIGIALFAVGIYLMSDMFMKFLKFFIGLILFIIGLQMILGAARFRIFRF